MHDFGDPRNRHSQIERETIHAELKRFHEFGAQNFSGMDRGKQMLRFSHFLRASGGRPLLFHGTRIGPQTLLDPCYCEIEVGHSPAGRPCQSDDP